MFHTVLTASADMVIGHRNHDGAQYGMVYRSVEHRRLRNLCLELSKQTPRASYRPCLPANGWGINLPTAFKSIPDLYERRQNADYNPLHRVSVSQSREAVDLARIAMQRFAKASVARRHAFLTLLMFPPRG